MQSQMLGNEKITEFVKEHNVRLFLQEELCPSLKVAQAIAET